MTGGRTRRTPLLVAGRLRSRTDVDVQRTLPADAVGLAGAPFPGAVPIVAVTGADDGEGDGVGDGDGPVGLGDGVALGAPEPAPGSVPEDPTTVSLRRPGSPTRDR